MTAPNGPDAGRYRNAETALGGADAVPDTPDVAAHGTEPGGSGGAERRQAPRGSEPLARVSAGGGPPAIVWVGGVLALIVLVVFGLGVFR